jgi:hypothetical protein
MFHRRAECYLVKHFVVTWRVMVRLARRSKWGLSPWATSPVGGSPYFRERQG